MENFLSISHPSCFSPAAASNLTSFHDESAVSGHLAPCHICLHYFLPFSSSVLFSHSFLPFYPCVFFLRFLLPFSSSVRSLLPFSLIHSSFIPLFHLPSRLSFCLPSSLPFQSVSYKSDKHTENKNPTTICLLQTEGYSTLFSTYPPVSVFQTSAEHSENKSHTGFPLLQTAGGGHQSVKQHLASKH